MNDMDFEGCFESATSTCGLNNKQTWNLNSASREQ